MPPPLGMLARPVERCSAPLKNWCVKHTGQHSRKRRRATKSLEAEFPSTPGPKSFILHRALNFNERVDTVPKVVPSEVVYGAVNGGC